MEITNDDMEMERGGACSEVTNTIDTILFIDEMI